MEFLKYRFHYPILSSNNVRGICHEFKWDMESHGSWLLSCIAFETAKTFNPAIKNAAGSGATGLIQFMPATARGLGTTTAELAKMPAPIQMLYVGKYFKPYAKKIKSLEDMYMAILYPKYIGALLDTIVFADPTIGYRQNSGFDKNKDGKVTKFEICATVRKIYEEGMFKENRLDILA